MKIKVTTSGRELYADIKAGENLLDAVNRAGLTGFDAPCGGKGSCGKCRIEISSFSASSAPSPDDVEQELLSDLELARGIRLACRVFPSADMEIIVSDSGDSAAIQSGFSGELLHRIVNEPPSLKRTALELPPPSIDDQRTDYRRLSDALMEHGISAGLDLEAKRKLPSLLRENDYRLTALSLFGCLTGFESSSDRLLAVAVDIGTTTLVAYLVELDGPRRGEVVDYVSGLNEQKGRGGDVVSRIEYCMRASGNLDELAGRIRSQISRMAAELCRRHDLGIDSIALVTIAGNTTMTHLFSGLNPEGIASAPFIPVDLGLCTGPASSFGLDCGINCSCAVLPGISAYVGSDITAGIVASEMHRAGELTLFIDIGTNGEIVLGGESGLAACSTAAGPALEGANISCGMGGVAGAVNRITVTEQDEHEVFQLSVIGGGEPKGICGSGIVDALALFITSGLIDETGRILSESELSDAGTVRGWMECLTEAGGMPALRIAEGILITQQDVREIQMAKAAIAAGIKTLLSETGREASEIARVLIAGGFGAAMNRKSAAVVGLFPSELEGVVEVAGNTAGKGAILGALSEDAVWEMTSVAETVEYIELSTSLKFQQEYMNEMYFRQ